MTEELDILDRAICKAVEAHRGMTRKIRRVPYILHPLEAVTIVGGLTDDKEIMAAAALHDVVEDTDMELPMIEEEFGSRVAQLVASETEDKHRELPPGDTWRMRKEDSLRVLRETQDMAIKILWLGDKLSNMRSFFRAWLLDGDSIWQNFNQNDKTQQEWYYREVASLTSELKDTAEWMEYNELVTIIFAEKE